MSDALEEGNEGGLDGLRLGGLSAWIIARAEALACLGQVEATLTGCLTRALDLREGHDQ